MRKAKVHSKRVYWLECPECHNPNMAHPITRDIFWIPEEDTITLPGIVTCDNCGTTSELPLPFQDLYVNARYRKAR